MTAAVRWRELLWSVWGDFFEKVEKYEKTEKYSLISDKKEFEIILGYKDIKRKIVVYIKMYCYLPFYSI